MTIVQCVLIVWIATYKMPMQATGKLVEIRNGAWMVDLTDFYKENTGLPHKALVQSFAGNNCLLIKGELPYGK